MDATGLVPPSVLGGAATTADLLTVVAMAALGLGIDVRAIGIRRKLDWRFVQGFALGDDITRADTFHEHAGEHQMGRRRPDVDAHAEQLDFLFLGNMAGGTRKPPAGFLSVTVIGHP